jgi:hypothetical protein
MAIMTIQQFLEQNTELLRNEIIPELGSDFTTFDFIGLFSKKFEGEYIDFLYQYRGQGAFRAVQSQFARFLDENKPLLGIDNSPKSMRENDFVRNKEVIRWKKKKNTYKETYY